MKYRPLGSSNLQVSEISLGSWLTFGGGVERRRAIECVQTALELGITLFDTANVYALGAAESLLGEALEGVPRESYVLATKLYFPMNASDRWLSRAQIIKQLDASLKRLRTNFVDLYQCHRFDHETPLEETMEALTEVVRQGKVRFLGFSEWPAEAIRNAAKMVGVERFVSSQPQYSLLWRQPEREIFPLCQELGISQIVWSPLGQGLLTGKYRPGQPPPSESRAMNGSMGHFFRRDMLGRQALEAIERVCGIARETSLTPAQFALAWTLRSSSVASAIVGATRPEQIAENVVASGQSVAPASFAEAEKILNTAFR